MNVLTCILFSYTYLLNISNLIHILTTIIYCIKIGSSITRRDIEKEFERYGTLLEVWMSRTRPSFAFVVYKRDKDAAEAQKRTNGM